MKRFYTEAAVMPHGEGLAIALDGKAVRTPAGQLLLAGHADLAEAIAAEWRGQGEEILPHSMPLCQLLSTALDRVIPNRFVIVEQLMNYAGTDLLCYRAESPRDLVERQERVWQPLIDWVLVAFGVEMQVTRGVIPISQPTEAIAALENTVAGYDPLRLTALQSAVPATGSLVLGLALVEERLTAEEAFAISQLDETYQTELWGEDPEAARARAALRRDIAAASRFLELSVRKDMQLGH
ncbi:ATP12 family chaperone protein [Telmatospirillum siberiense]|uniref:ATPase n=1 Tax=Telmatospirillum siberiense TaxID=382514 RepID=A0A2N3PNA6_9PROT|nr:ATP12 family protein [Telmatospirillum siberiense]PKU21882.1 ATPase [Telmatospirillum siberiense]